MFYSISRAICILFFKIIGCRIKVAGRNNIPNRGGFILASNHLSNIDPVVLGIVCRRRLNYMAKEELFRIPVLSWMIRHYGAFPVRRNTPDFRSIRQAIERLKSGCGLVVFPEGSRGVMQQENFKIHGGIAFLARRTDVPIVPAYIRLSLIHI